jgi:hypothetical protein
MKSLVAVGAFFDTGSPCAFCTIRRHVNPEDAMWDRITRLDFQRAKLALDQKRAELLSRHAEEIEQSDAQLRDVESFGWLVRF